MQTSLQAPSKNDLFPSTPLNSLPLSFPTPLLALRSTKGVSNVSRSLVLPPPPASTPAPSLPAAAGTLPPRQCRPPPTPPPPPPLRPRCPAASADAVRSSQHNTPPPPHPPVPLPAAAPGPRPRSTGGGPVRAMPALRSPAGTRPPPSGASPRRYGVCGHPRRYPPPASATPPVSGSR
jgi:WAS/WASL-interacting protein